MISSHVASKCNRCADTHNPGYCFTRRLGMIYEVLVPEGHPGQRHSPLLIVDLQPKRQSNTAYARNRLARTQPEGITMGFQTTTLAKNLGRTTRVIRQEDSSHFEQEEMCCSPNS